jgi:hypothetical protein
VLDETCAYPDLTRIPRPSLLATGEGRNPGRHRGGRHLTTAPPDEMRQAGRRRVCCAAAVSARSRWGSTCLRSRRRGGSCRCSRSRRRCCGRSTSGCRPRATCPRPAPPSTARWRRTPPRCATPTRPGPAAAAGAEGPATWTSTSSTRSSASPTEPLPVSGRVAQFRMFFYLFLSLFALLLFLGCFPVMLRVSSCNCNRG